MTSRTDRPLSVLAIHRYYWPDSPPYASMLRAIVAHWRQVGYEPEVFSTQPSYKPSANIPRRPKLEIVDGSPVRRITLPRERHRAIKALNLLLFTAATFATSCGTGVTSSCARPRRQSSWAQQLRLPRDCAVAHSSITAWICIRRSAHSPESSETGGYIASSSGWIGVPAGERPQSSCCQRT